MLFSGHANFVFSYLECLNYTIMLKNASYLQLLLRVNCIIFVMASIVYCMSAHFPAVLIYYVVIRNE